MLRFRVRSLVAVVLLVASIATTAITAEPVADSLRETFARGGLPNVAAKIKAGAEIHVAYLGGSITAAPGWRVLSFEWLKKEYPQVKFVEINAAIGGTGSDFGACRFPHDVLVKKPDFLFVEFAVNDGGASEQRIIRGMEGIVRQTWRADPTTDICFVYTLVEGNLPTFQAGKLPNSSIFMEKVAEYYQIPSIHFGVEVAKLEKAGQLIFTGKLPTNDAEKAAVAGKIIFSGDKVHPHVATGHPLYLQSLQRAWPALIAAGQSGRHELKTPLDASRWERVTNVMIGELKKTGNWQKLPPTAPPVKNTGRSAVETWTASEAGATLTFKFRGTHFGFDGLKGPDAGNFRITVDDRPAVTAAQFDAYCSTDRWRVNPWYYPQELPPGEHTVTVELLGTTPDKEKILKTRNETITKPEQLQAACLYLSRLMVIGELLHN